MTLPADTAAALSEVREGGAGVARAMPASFYRDAGQLAAEIEPVFLGGWLCVGRTDEVPKVGDRYALELLDEPLIVCRGEDERVRVLSNVCRHRGSVLVEGRGGGKRVTCPYHRWSYALDGRLLAAPLVEKTEGFDRAACSLPVFRTAEWMGWLFVNLDGRADDFDVATEGVDAWVRNYHPEEMRTVEAAPERWPLNWKCLVENFMEGYHLTPVHRETLHPMTPTRLCEKIPGGRGYTGYKSHYSPSFPGRRPFHPDTSDEERSQSMMIWIYPSFVAAISPNSAVYMSVTPTGPEELQTRWGVVAREELFASGEARERHDFARAFNAEDRDRLVAVQRGLRSRFGGRGPLAPPDLEGTVSDFYAHMAERLTPRSAG